MKKILKTILGFLSLVFIIGGALVLGWQYFRNKQLFVVLMNNSIVKGSLSVLRTMGFAVLAIVIGLIFTSIYFKVGSSIRRDEREKNAALREQQREQEERNRQLREEAEAAKAEADLMKRELESQQTSTEEKED